jgi:hypothetical protein
MSFFKKNHYLHHPAGGLDTERWKYGVNLTLRPDVNFDATPHHRLRA